MAITHTFVCAIADDATAAANGEVVPSNWNADHAVTNLVLTHGTIATDVNTLGATVTWNAAGVTFTAQKVNVTDTASASGSLLADWQVGGTSKAKISKSGALMVAAGTAAAPGLFFSDESQTGFYKSASTIIDVAIGGSQCFRFSNNGFFFPKSTGTVSLSSAGRFGWEVGIAGNASPDLAIYRDAAATLAQRDGTNAQTLRVYGTYTDSSNYVRASLAATSTTVTLAAETAGTGADNVDVTITPAGTGGVDIGAFYHQLSEMTAPAAPAANGCRIYAVDNGGGKTQLMALFSSGAAQQLAIQP